LFIFIPINFAKVAYLYNNIIHGTHLFLNGNSIDGRIAKSAGEYNKKSVALCTFLC
jgi:hypothetical protein